MITANDYSLTKMTLAIFRGLDDTTCRTEVNLLGTVSLSDMEAFHSRILKSQEPGNIETIGTPWAVLCLGRDTPYFEMQASDLGKE